MTNDAPGAPKVQGFEEQKVTCFLFNDIFVVVEPQSKKADSEQEVPLQWIDFVTLHDSFLKKMPTESMPLCSKFPSTSTLLMISLSSLR